MNDPGLSKKVALGQLSASRGHVLATAAPHPFRAGHGDVELPVGMTLLEILEAVQPDPLLRAHAHIFLDEERIGRERWGSFLPREGQRVLINVVPMGGGEGGKNPLRVILTMAVVVVASVFGAGLGGAIFGKLGLATTGIAGKFATAIGTTLIGTGGLLLVNAIAPIRPPSGHEQEQDSPNYFIDRARNTARPFAPVPVVLGKHRMVPPLGAATYTEVPEKRQESYKEDLGDEQYLRLLVVWGYGPLKVRDLKIGETPITDFQGVHVETREGREGEPDLETYPKDVNEQALSIKLEQTDGWSSRTTAADADEISIDLTLPQGLARLDDQGKRQTLSVAFDLQYKEVGATEWKRPPFVETRSRPAPVPDPSVPDLYTFLDSGLWGGRATTDSSWETHTATTSSVTLTSNRSTPARVGYSWHVPQRGQYEVRLRRTTLDRTSDREFDQLYWTALRSFTNEDPIAFGQPLARTAIVIRATDQLHGSVDQLNAVVSSPVLDWNGTAWVEAETSNPASLYRHVLQGPARANPVPDEQIDLEALQDWHEFCETNGNEYNAVRDFQGSIYDALADIASVGRASPSYADGKWSVVVDDGQQTPVQHFTPRNSSDFSAERHFEAAPHALRIRFANREEGWRRDERIVYRDDYSEIATAASRALSFDSNPSANDTVQIGSTTYTFTPSLSLAGAVLIGSTAEDSAANLIAAITAGQGDGTAYGTGTTAHASVTAALGETNTQVVITALSTGPDGNSITVSVEPSAAESRITGEGSLEGGSYGAENFFSLDAPGITDPEHVYRFGRFHLAQLLLRRELWSFQVDFEYLVATRGDRVLLSHDVLLVGQKSARIRKLLSNGAGHVTGIEIDEQVQMVSGTSYGVSIRTVEDAAVKAQVVTTPGETASLTFARDLPSSSAAVAGEVARLNLTTGRPPELYREGVSGTLEAGSDAEVATGLTLNRVRGQADQSRLVLNFASGSIAASTYWGTGLPGASKSIFIYDGASGIEIGYGTLLGVGSQYVAFKVSPDSPESAFMDNVAAGESLTLVIADATPAIPGVDMLEVGNLLTFGEYGRETLDGLVVSVEPSTDLSARVSIMPWSSPGVYDAETGTIPAYESGLTPLPGRQALVIENVVSDGNALVLEGGILVPRIVVEVRPISEPTAQIECQIRASGTSEPYYNAQIVTQTPGSMTISGVEDGGTYDLRLRWRVPGALLPGTWTEHLGHTVVGQSSVPPALTGLALHAWGENSILIRWDPITTADARVGGQVRFRHSKAAANPTWGNAVSIGEPIDRQSYAILPAKPGWYLARVFDASGRGSGVVIIGATSSQLLDYASLSTITESPTFPGAKTDVQVSGSALVLDAGETEGTYEFDNEIDLGSTKPVRVTSVIQIEGTDRTDAHVEFRTTTDDPASASAAWTAWRRLDAEQILARGFEFRLQMRRAGADPLRVTVLGAVVDEPITSGINWRGNWSSGTSYESLDSVSYDNASWICIQAHAASSSNAPGTAGGDAYWDILVDSLRWKGTWTEGENYITRDIVASGGRSWVCTGDHTASAANQPTSENSGGTYWDLLADVGVAGNDGHGLEWRGDWATGVQYRNTDLLQDLVSHDGQSFICLQTHTSTGADAPGTTGGAAFWDLLAGLEIDRRTPDAPDVKLAATGLGTDAFYFLLAGIELSSELGEVSVDRTRIQVSKVDETSWNDQSGWSNPLQQIEVARPPIAQRLLVNDYWTYWVSAQVRNGVTRVWSPWFAPLSALTVRSAADAGLPSAPALQVARSTSTQARRGDFWVFSSNRRRIWDTRGIQSCVAICSVKALLTASRSCFARAFHQSSSITSENSRS